MATVSVNAETTRHREVARVDPRAPRFGQTITTLGLVAGIILGSPAIIFVITAILLTAVLTRWRYDPYGILWRRVIQPVVGKPYEQEAAAPHRFAKLLGAFGTTLASLFILVGIPLVGYIIVAGVAAAAGLAAVTGICLGCRMYRQVTFFRRLNVV